MDSQRNILLMALVVASFFLFQQWQQDHAPDQPLQIPVTVQHPIADLPTSTAAPPQTIQPELVLSHPITLRNDVLALTINPQGGDIVEAQLLTYPRNLHDPRPLPLLEHSPDFVYQAQSGLIGPDGPDRQATGRPIYQAAQQHHQLTGQQTVLEVPLCYRNDQGVTLRKIFILRQGDYAVEVQHEVINHSERPIQIQLFGQLKQSIALPKEQEKGRFALQTYRGMAYSTTEKRYQKYNFNELKKRNLALTTQQGWVAMLQHYFVSAWIPETNHHYEFYTKYLGQKQQAVIGFTGELLTLLPKEQRQLSAKIWLGPELQENMATVAKYLDLTVDYGWLWFISQPLFKLLKFLQHFVGNWGLAIIGVTLLVRLLLYPLTKAQYTSMAKLRVLQPKIQAIRDRYGDDRQLLSQETMKLYQREKVNPLGGCLPLLIQMPIFLALYWMLVGSVELRHAPFILWIHDLSAPDPYYLLPLLMGLSMLLIQKLSPSPVTDPMQQKVMMIMPAIFTLFFLWLPAGLVLYYVVSNLLTLLQQQLITHQLEKQGLSLR